MRRPWLVLGASVAVLAGLGGYTFIYAEGLSYFGTDPKTCVNCHIMNDQYSSWQKASHHAVATCVDCHLPHALIPKFVAKGDHGFRHSKAFTFQDFHEPIQITKRDLDIVQANCERCHGDLVSEMLQRGSPPSDRATCTKCHPAVGHRTRN